MLITLLRAEIAHIFATEPDEAERARKIREAMAAFYEKAKEQACSI